MIPPLPPLNPGPSGIWSRLAAVRAEERRADSRDTGAPYGFAGRVVQRWREMERAEKLRFWRVWSLRSSLAALAVLVVLSASGRPRPGNADGPPPVLLEPPVLSIPLP